MRILTKTALMVVVVFGSAAIARAAGPDWDALAKHMVSLSDRQTNPRGVCAVPGGGELAFALTRASEFYVVAQEATPEAMQAACARADREGLLERRMTIAEGLRGTCILADCYANLFVLTGVTDAELPRLDVPKILRRLAPHGGQAVIGLAKGENGTLSKAGLESWAKGFALPTARVVEDAAGLWAVVTRPPLPDSAEWTHNLFDASSNPYTSDTAFAWPPMTQWVGKPYQKAGAVGVIGGGILFAVTEEKSAVTGGNKVQTQSGRMGYPNVDSGVLFARDLYNGQILWMRTMQQGGKYSPDGFTSAYVYHNGELFVIDGASARVLVLDAVSGREKRRLDLSSLGAQVKWIAICDGTLLALAGTEDKRAPIGSIYRYAGPFACGGGNFQPEGIGFGRVIGALDASTAQVRWRHDEGADSIHEYHICARDGRIYFLAEGRRLAALDLKGGAVSWSNSQSARVPEQRTGTYWAYGQTLSGGLVAGNDALVAVSWYGTGLYDYITFGVDPRDGHELWRKGVRSVGPDGRSNPAAASFSRFFMRDRMIIGPRVGLLDCRTGVAVANNPWPGVHKNGLCGMFTGSVNVLCGQMGIAYDFAGKTGIGEYVQRKSHCAFGPRIGEGVCFSMPHECSCGYNLTRGWGADVSAGDFDLRQQPTEVGRLRRSPGVVPATTPSGVGDWPMYRGSLARANASPVSALPDGYKPAVRWTWRPAVPFPVTPQDSMTSQTEYEAAQPITFGSLVICGGPDGAVRAFDLAGGAVRWTAFTGGRIAISPTACDGRIYVGSCDGCVYCLDAATGQEAWRFRAAPEERRVLFFGHLASTWPVMTGVTVNDGVAYFAAGLYGYNGGWLYAVDAHSGALRWSTPCGALDAKKRTGLSVGGALTIAHGQVWMRNHGFRLTDGVLQNPPRESDIRYLLCTGLYGDSFLMTGGGNLTAEQHEQPRAKNGTQQAMTFYPLTATGVSIRRQNNKQQPEMIPLFLQAWSLPSWDARLTLVAPNQGAMNSGVDSRRASTLVACATPAFEQFLKGDPETIPGMTEREEGTKGRMRNLPKLAGEQWRLERHRWYASVLASDAVIGAYATADQQGALTCHIGWFARDAGAERSIVDLPGEPRADGIAVAADGTVLVQLLDGTVVAVGTTR